MASVESWENKARQLQRTFSCQYHRCGELDYATHSSSIKTFLGLALYGIPENDNLTDTDLVYMLYREDQQKVIDSIYSSIGKVMETSTVLFLRNTFLVLKDEGEENEKFLVIFPFSFTENGRVLFTDAHSRIYEDWNDFLGNNQLPPCCYCAPVNGYYESNGEFIFTQSPANEASNKTLNVLDVAGSVAVVGSAVVGSIAAGPVIVPAAIFTGIGASIYCAGRSISRLVDRSYHKQSIGLEDKESRMCYFNLATSLLNGVAVGAVAKSSALVSRFGANAVTGIRVLNNVTIAVDGICLADSLYSVYSKYAKDGTIDDAELFCVAVQVFFLTLSVVNIRKLHTELAAASQNKTPMTKTQKRNLRRKMAKARLRGDVNVNSNMTIKQYDNGTISNDTFCNNLIRQCPRLVLTILPKSASTIIRTFTVIRNIFDDFQNNIISEFEFFYNIAQHIHNVWYIVKQDFDDLLSKVEHFFNQFGPLLCERFRSIAALLRNGISEIDDIEADPDENSLNFVAIEDITLDPLIIINQTKKCLADIIKNFEYLSSENFTASITCIIHLHKELMNELTNNLNEEMKCIRQQILDRNASIFTEQIEGNLRNQVINTDQPFIAEAMRKVSIKFDREKLKNIFVSVKARCEELEQAEKFFVSKFITGNKITDCLNNLSDIIFQLYECVSDTSFKSNMFLINQLTDFVCNEFETSARKSKYENNGVYNYLINVEKYTMEQCKKKTMFNDKYVWDEVCENFKDANQLKNQFPINFDLVHECRENESDYSVRNNDSEEPITLEELDRNLNLNIDDANSNEGVSKSQKILYIVGRLIEQGVLRNILKTTNANISTLVRMLIAFVQEKIKEDMRKWRNELGVFDLFTIISDKLTISIYENGDILMSEFVKFCTFKIQDERTQILNDLTVKDGEIYLEDVDLRSHEDVWRILKKLFDINRECCRESIKIDENNNVLLEPNCDNIQFIIMIPLNDYNNNCAFIACFRREAPDDDDDS